MLYERQGWSAIIFAQVAVSLFSMAVLLSVSAVAPVLVAPARAT